MSGTASGEAPYAPAPAFTQTGKGTQSPVSATIASTSSSRPLRRRARPRYRSRFSVTPGSLIALVSAGALAIAILAVHNAPPPVHIDVPLIAHLSGLLAGYGIATMLVLMSRAPALERGVGADRLARWHALGGRINFALIAIHAVCATLAWAHLVQADLATAILRLLTLPGLTAATVGTLVLFVVGLVSMRTLRKRFSYERWHLIHLSAYIGAGLAFAHQLAGPDLAGWKAGQILWGLLYSYAYFLVLRHRLISPLYQMWRHRLKVQEVIPEADGVVSIVVRGKHIQELEAEPGQFFRWRFVSRRTWLSAHPFSLSAPPGPDSLRLTVKALGEGSRRLQTVRPGTWVFAEGPYGAMTAQRRRRSAVLLVAGGIGITPMRALFESLPVPGHRLTLLYRASSSADVVFRTELEDIARQRGARLIYLIGSSSDPANAMTSASLSRLVPDLVHHDVFLCASPGLSRAVKTALLEAGLPRGQLHEEEFSF
jgi:predicted ferric reductase